MTWFRTWFTFWSQIDQDDFINLALKPVDTKKLMCWCEAVRTRSEKMLSSSVPPASGPTLVSSEVLTLMTFPSRSPQKRVKIPPPRARVIQRERNMCQRMTWRYWVNSHRWHTVDVTGNTNSTVTVSGGSEAPAKKAKIMLTEKQLTFVKMFQTVVSKIDKPSLHLLVSDVFQGKNEYYSQ
jgi:hypothetical protein